MNGPNTHSDGASDAASSVSSISAIHEAGLSRASLDSTRITPEARYGNDPHHAEVMTDNSDQILEGGRVSVLPKSDPLLRQRPRNDTEGHKAQAVDQIEPSSAAAESSMSVPGGLDQTTGRLTWKTKIGVWAVCILLMGTVVNLACAGMLGFLWFGDIHNSTWHAIIVRNWLSNAITIISETLKQSIGFQVGTAAAMLAALVIERFEVELPNAASIALLRSSVFSSGAILVMSWKQRKRSIRLLLHGQSVLALYLILFSLIYMFAQVITIILISDVGLAQIPGRHHSAGTAFGFTVLYDANARPPQAVFRDTSQPAEFSSWVREPQAYPAFAEYSESPFEAPGVSDTGLTLRAFLPFAAASERESVQSYIGRTTVLDSRVTCQSPQLFNETIQYITPSLYLNGSFMASRATPRLYNFTNVLVPTSGNEATVENDLPVPFSCVAAPYLEDIVEPVPGDTRSQQWAITICQLVEAQGDSGGLISEFVDLASLPNPDHPSGPAYINSSQIGTAYLVLNVSLGNAPDWEGVIEKVSSPLAHSTRNEWLDLIFSRGKLVLSVTLCYAAFDTADVPVQITAARNRTEPAATYEISEQRYTFSAVRHQLGQHHGAQSLEDRGLLNLQRQRSSWLAEGEERGFSEPVLRYYADLAGPRAKASDSDDGNHGNITAVMWEAEECSVGNAAQVSAGISAPETTCPDVTYVWLFQEILRTGGSVAFALQSLITVLAGVEYYTVLPQFDKSEQVEQVYFVTANVARHWAGFCAVIVVLAVHTSLLVLVLVMFLRGTRHTMLGETWSAVAQLVAGRAREYVDAAAGMSDGEVERRMRHRGKERQRVGIGAVDGTDRVGLVERTEGGGEHQKAEA